jgi:DNA-binding MarR family transcriptional regulator
VEQDHVDRFISSLPDELDIDPAVERIVDRINGLGRRFRRMAEETLAERGLSFGEYKLLGFLRHARPEPRASAGTLARWTELSSGAMTNRLDRVESAGLVRRLPDPDDRRGILVELTDAGRKAYDEAVGAQAQAEILMASALSQREQDRLNALLRRLMLAFEAQEAEAAGKRRP